MAHPLAARYPAFRDALARCTAAMAPSLDVDLLGLLDDHGDRAGLRPQQTQYAQPALFAVEYAMASLLMEVGIAPAALLGHSIGEYVAACLAGVFTVEDAASLVADRGRLMSEAPPGVMLAVMLSEAEARLWTGADISLAAVNGPRACVLAGAIDAVARIERQLEATRTARRVCPRAAHERCSSTCRRGGAQPPLPRLPRFRSGVTGWCWPTAAGWARPSRAGSTRCDSS